MPKLKDLLPSIFTTNNANKNVPNGTTSQLEFDAAPVRDQDEIEHGTRNSNEVQSPTVSAELTDSVVRELNDVNYNSATGVVMDPNSNSGLMSATSATNTMNVQNNQQQNIVMQFSNASNLHFGSVYNFNSNIKTNTSSKACDADELKAGCGSTCSPNIDGKRSTPRKTTSIVAMMQSQEEPNHRILDAIATHLGEGWKEVMRSLGHSEGQIEQAIIDNQMHGGIKEVIYQLLLEWVRGADDNAATLGFITNLLWELNHRECVQRMKSVWKSGSNRKSSKNIKLQIKRINDIQNAMLLAWSRIQERIH